MIWKNLPVPSVQGVHCGTSKVWPGIFVQQQYSQLKNHIRILRFQTDEDVQEEVKRWLRKQNASFYRQDFKFLMYRYDKCLNMYADEA
jgi:hypothetical protein